MASGDIMEIIELIVLSVFIIATVCAGWSMIINEPTHRTYEEIPISNESMVSLSEGSGIHGGFILGSGSVSDIDYFYYYVGTTSFHKKKVPSDYTTIYMDEDTHPYITTIVLSYHSCNKIGNCTNNPAYYIGGYDNSGYDNPSRRYEMHVPNGTIIRDFSLGGTHE